MRPTKGVTKNQLVVVVVSLGAMAIVVLAIAFRRDIAAYLYLIDLQRNPELLFTAATEPEGSIPRYAVQKYLRTAGGRNALFELFLNSQRKAIKEGIEWNRKNSTEFVRGMIAVIDDSFSARFNYQNGDRCYFLGPVEAAIRKHAASKSLNSLLSQLVGGEFRSSLYPHYRFSFLPGTAALDYFSSSVRTQAFVIDASVQSKSKSQEAREALIRTTTALLITNEREVDLTRSQDAER